MTSELRPYPEYRETVEAWLGPIPSHWELRRAKYLLREIDTRWFERSGQLLSVSQYTGVTKRRLREGTDEPATRSETLEGYKVVALNDLAVNIMLAWNGSLGVSPFDGVVSPAYCVYRFREGNPWYFHNLLRSPAFRAEIKRRSRGVVESRLRLYSDDLFRIPLLIPPPVEQTAIVRFLGELDRKVARFIRTKRRLIEVLTEQKQAIITQAVTRGLYPQARLKPSGTVLGDVPEHWTVLPIKRAFISMDYGISESSTDDGSIRVLTMGNIKGGRVTIPASGGVNAVDPSLLLAPDDLLFNRTNSPELVGKVGIFTGHASDVTFASYLVRLRPHARHSPAYLNLVLNENSVLGMARREAVPSLHQSNLNPTRYGRLAIVLPERSEQEAILLYVSEHTSALDRAVSQAESEIELFREYRTRLAADVVTGKLDVRAAAASLPDDIEDEVEPVVIDEADDIEAETIEEAADVAQ